MNDAHAVKIAFSGGGWGGGLFSICPFTKCSFSLDSFGYTNVVYCICVCLCAWADQSTAAFEPVHQLILPSSHLARLAAEEQVHDLQELIDETFKQFALDDSEDDYYYSEDSNEASSCGLPVTPDHTGLKRATPTRSGLTGTGITLPSIHSVV